MFYTRGETGFPSPLMHVLAGFGTKRDKRLYFLCGLVFATWGYLWPRPFYVWCSKRGVGAWELGFLGWFWWVIQFLCLACAV